MTKTKADISSPTHFVSPKEKRQRQKMESGNETGDSVQAQAPSKPHQFEQQPAVQQQPLQGKDKKKVNRAPSPARPKDGPGWALTKIRGGIGTPTLSVKPGAIYIGSRMSRRSPGSGKDAKLEKGKLSGKAMLSVAPKGNGKSTKVGRRKISDASNISDDLSKDSGCAPGKLSPTGSSSELSDCASEENKLSTDALSSDTETSSRGRAADNEKSVKTKQISRRPGKLVDDGSKTAEERDRLSIGMESGEGSISPGDERSATSFDSRMLASTSLAFSDLTEEFVDGAHEEFVREIEELRSENDYLKDEIEELRSEMLEMRDMYMEEDVYQLQDLRQQFDQANKTCRILQYRLRKAERRSLRVAQTGQVDGELIRTLEQDVKVAKDVSIRLHNELESVEKKRSNLEQENEELRVHLQDLEVAKQVLQTEMEKSRENSQKKRGSERRSNGKLEKKSTLQPEDSSDLKCQLHFAKEESALMCKKLTKLVKESESMREELAKFRSLYGQVDAAITVEEVADSPHTREAEVRVHLKLVEEEANLLSRRIVELEVENRGLRAEMDDMKGQDMLPGGMGVGSGGGNGGLLLLPGTENVVELQRHLQFVEEEAELLRRSLMELEDQNKLLMNDLNRCKSELPPPTPASCSEPDSPASSSPGPMSTTLLEEEAAAAAGKEPVVTGDETTSHNKDLLAARLQIGELNGKVKKLQYENRVLLSNLQRCDLAGSQRPAMETDAEAGDSAECVPNEGLREGPVGGEGHESAEDGHREAALEKPAALGLLISDCGHAQAPCLLKNRESLLAIHKQAQLVNTAIQLLISPDSGCLLSAASADALYRKLVGGDGGAAENVILEKSPSSPSADLSLVEALRARLRGLQSQLESFVERLETLGDSSPGREQVEGASPQPLLSESGGPVVGMPSASAPCPSDGSAGAITAEQKSDFRDQLELEVKGQEPCVSKSEEARHSHQDSNKDLHAYGQAVDTKEADLALSNDALQAHLSDARQKVEGTEQELSLERQAHRDDTHSSTHRLSQLQEEHQKALVRRDFQLQSLSLQSRLQQKFWSQERNQLVQESQQLKQSLVLLSLKLRWFLKQWRLGKKLEGDAKDILEVNNVKDLCLLLEEEALSPHQGDNKMPAAEEQQPLNPTSKEHCLQSYKQKGSVSATLADLQGALQDLSVELREERQGSLELTQQFAKAKAAWEVERTELKSLITQLEGKSGKSGALLATVAADKDPPDLKGSLKREHAEHQHLLAESYAAVMDLTKQLQISERSWGREKMDLLERLNQERSQWEQQLQEAQSRTEQAMGDKITERVRTSDAETNGTSLQRTKSISSIMELDSLLDTCPFFNSTEADKLRSPGSSSPLACSDLSGLNRKNWRYLTSECAPGDQGDAFKTWDCPSTSSSSSFPGLDLCRHLVPQRSYTAPDKTGIRIYYSPPAVRRMEARLPRARAQQQQPPHTHRGHSSRIGGAEGQTSVSAPTSISSLSLAYDQWLSTLSQQHREMLQGSPGVGGGAPFHGLEISGNLSDDMKEMTNCVRQAIRSSSLERKCNKDTGSQTVGVSSTGTQTARLVSVGMQTEGPSAGTAASRTGLHGKSWSPRPSSSLASARSRQISSSLEKVASRIDRPCCSPKYGSPKLQRRVSASSSRLETSSTTSASSARDRSLWSLHQRSTSCGSAWARSTTTRDSPVLSGLNDGLSSLFSVVEHTGSSEALWKADVGTSSPSRQQPAGKPSCPSPGVGLGDSPVGMGPHRYGAMQEFIRNVCGSRTPTPGPGVDEPKPDCLSGLLVGSDSVTKIVNKRFMKPPRDDLPAVAALGKDAGLKDGLPGTLEDSVCDCSSQSATSCLSRPSRYAARHSQGQCKHRLPENSPTTDEKVELNVE
ncbi:microtubule cross-linking factor 2 isoform X2 [Engraulis encrasicolus]|uniref:microtubule cross-linking factor 2 isoform X2 n=1 Tax=Engraulis encrasicolus TaxID=184585 RepID=UPI002FD63A58